MGMLMSFFCSCVIIALRLSSLRLGEHFSCGLCKRCKITTKQLKIIQWFISLGNVEVYDHNNLVWVDVKTAPHPPKKKRSATVVVTPFAEFKKRFAWCAGLSFFGPNSQCTIFFTLRTKRLCDKGNSINRFYPIFRSVLFLRTQKCQLLPTFHSLSFLCLIIVFDFFPKLWHIFQPETFPL